MTQLAPPPAAAVDVTPDRIATNDEPASTETRCPNCGAVSPRAYCPDCGQAQRDFHRPVHTFAGELVESLTGWDHKIPATVGLLLGRPGALTREFLAGRRKRYLSPFQLYLLTSALLFLALRTPLPGGQGLVSLTHSREAAARGGAGHPPAVGPLGAAAARTTPDTVRIRFALAGGAVKFQGDFNMADTADFARAARRGPFHARFIENVRRRWDDVGQRSSAEASAWAEGLFLGHLGTTLSILVPVFAALCMLLWRNARLFYAEHVVFAIHTHAQGLVAIALARATPGRLALLPTAWTLGYLWLAARRVYATRVYATRVYATGGVTGHESRARTTAKVALLSVVYFVIAGVGLILTFVASLLLGS